MYGEMLVIYEVSQEGQSHVGGDDMYETWCTSSIAFMHTLQSNKASNEKGGGYRDCFKWL